MPRLRRVASTRYQGWDEEARVSVSAEPGSVLTVSASKATQLLAEFPGDWAALGASRRANGPPAPSDEVVAQLAARLTAGDTAESLAEELGVDQATIYRWTKRRRRAAPRVQGAPPAPAEGS